MTFSMFAVVKEQLERIVSQDVKCAQEVQLWM